MRHFTHTTRVQTHVKILRERILPVQGEVITRAGQKVSPVQIVARTPRQRDFHILPLSDLLGITPDDLLEQLLVKLGDDIETGMPLIKRPGLLRRNYTSPVEGKLYRVGNGRLIIEQTAGWIELRAMVAGRIVNQIPERGVIIELFGSRIQAIWSSGKDSVGKLKVVARAADSPLVTFQVGQDAADHILVTGKINQFDVLQTAAENNVRGIITGSMQANLCHMVSDLPYPIIVTDGFGQTSMAQPIFQLLQQANNREVSLFGQVDLLNQERPEIIIPAEKATNVQETPPQEGLAIGQLVRIVRPPYESEIGQVNRLYTRKKTTEIGINAYGADITLNSGQIVYIPYANLDVLI